MIKFGKTPLERYIHRISRGTRNYELVPIDTNNSKSTFDTYHLRIGKFKFLILDRKTNGFTIASME